MSRVAHLIERIEDEMGAESADGPDEAEGKAAALNPEHLRMAEAQRLPVSSEKKRLYDSFPIAAKRF